MFHIEIVTVAPFKRPISKATMKAAWKILVHNYRELSDFIIICIYPNLFSMIMLSKNLLDFEPVAVHCRRKDHSRLLKLKRTILGNSFGDSLISDFLFVFLLRP